MRTTLPRQHCPAQRRGMSITEVVASIVLVSLVMIGALNCVAGITSARMVIADSLKARHLAEQLMAEITNQAYADPNETAVFGVEVTEIATPRSGYDDVDDYDGWSASPPRDHNNAVISGLGGWQRDVSVKLLDAATPELSSASDQGLKQIVVTVRKDGRVLAQHISVRSNAN